MTIVKRVSGDILTGTTHVGAGAVSGEARIKIGLGAPVGRIVRVEFKGDDANVDNNNTLALTDGEGRIIFAAAALDAGTDDSTTKATSQTQLVNGAASTVGVAFNPAYPAAADLENDATAGTEGEIGILARSPITATILSGTDGDYHRVTLFVEV